MFYNILPTSNLFQSYELKCWPMKNNEVHLNENASNNMLPDTEG